MQPRKDLAAWFGFPLNFFPPFGKVVYNSNCLSLCSYCDERDNWTPNCSFYGEICSDLTWKKRSQHFHFGSHTTVEKHSYSWTVIMVLPLKFWQSFPLQPLSLTVLLCSISSARFPNKFANRIGNIYLEFVPLNKQLLQKRHTILCCNPYFITVSAVKL